MPYRDGMHGRAIGRGEGRSAGANAEENDNRQKNQGRCSRQQTSPNESPAARHAESRRESPLGFTKLLKALPKITVFLDHRISPRTSAARNRSFPRW
jgi:hypothetical protein